ncbi:2'-5' RNA ligase family protein [Flavobacterium sp. xlx-214]|uniref:2'-5' RNA ligase family protein n=1 Tax=unclassified Flavobacterium TaxID=196869 RepID=UPI0013D88E14|nr:MULTISPECIES: 2'-5' RNA ligase family protein [unclassified Flavobacterium]MBA5792231.1 2'-5' RNA ligase family protein [Flavobacterium sp. xlx-221]QMI84473.1 2'-5' RNA ligase family protein [Flavobacterium sp. xlx-214]
MNKYSVVFMPDAQTIALIKEMKLRLSDEIGWFNSKNSLAHFTLFEFLEEAANESQFCKQLERIASEINPFEMTCDAFDSFENGAFYIKPNTETSLLMANEMKTVLKESTSIKKTITNTTPHLTIGRRLNNDQLMVAKQMFQEIDISFFVAHLTLRKFNEQTRQFDLYQHFPLLGKPKEIQGSLF